MNRVNNLSKESSGKSVANEFAASQRNFAREARDLELQ
jgi:hypothetical protein